MIMDRIGDEHAGIGQRLDISREYPAASAARIAARRRMDGIGRLEARLLASSARGDSFDRISDLAYPEEATRAVVSQGFMAPATVDTQPHRLPDLRVVCQLLSRNKNRR